VAKGLYLNNIIFFLAILTPPQKSAKKWQNSQILPKYPFFGFFGGIGGKKIGTVPRSAKMAKFCQNIHFLVFFVGYTG